MKFSEKWLRTWINPNISTDELLQKFTNVGLEIEGVEGDIVEMNITPNRGDCLSILGLARELSVLCETPVTFPETFAKSKPKEEILDKIEVDLLEKKSCPVYIGRIIKGIDNTVDTPLWIKERLQASDIGLISPVVDITNYVMLELGQPMHAFDLSKLDEKIVVRNANNNETITLLDGKEVKLDSDTLVIADNKKPLAIAGIMGGKFSSVVEKTKDILLESAYFDPTTIRKSVQKYNIYTDSSYRFERHVDFALQVKAIERATELILDIVGGKPGPILHNKENSYLPKTLPITLRKSRIEKILGIKIDSSRILTILDNLQMTIKDVDSNTWEITPPSFRSDLQIEEDFVEEIARIIGYDNIPAELPKIQLNFDLIPENKLTEYNLKSMLVAKGYNEVITYSFIDPDLSKLFLDKDIEDISLANPISKDLSTMRTSLIPSLILTLKKNQHRQQFDLKLFETGLMFAKKKNSEEVIQEKMLACLLSGNKCPLQWSSELQAVNFYDLKGDLEFLTKKINYNKSENNVLTFKPIKKKFLHEGQTAAIYKNDEYIGIIGAIHPNIVSKLDIKGPIFVFEVNYNKLVQGNLPVFKSISKYPAVKRDLAIIVDKTQDVGSILLKIKNIVGQDLEGINVFDVFEGKSIEKGKKSVAIQLIFQKDDATFNEEEITKLVDKIIETLQKKFKAILRT